MSAATHAKARTGPDARWQDYDEAELFACDKPSLDIFSLSDDSLADSDNLPPPEIIVQEIVEDLEAAMEHFGLLLEALRRRRPSPTPTRLSSQT